MANKKQLRRLIDKQYYKGFDTYNYPNSIEHQNVLKGMAILTYLYDHIFNGGRNSKPNKSQRKFMDRRKDNELRKLIDDLPF